MGGGLWVLVGGGWCVVGAGGWRVVDSTLSDPHHCQQQPFLSSFEDVSWASNLHENLADFRALQIASWHFEPLPTPQCTSGRDE